MPKKGPKTESPSAADQSVTTSPAHQNDHPSLEEIAARAYTYYDQEGRIDGRADDHWLRAEADLLRERTTRTRGAGNGNPDNNNAPRSRRQTQG